MNPIMNWLPTWLFHPLRTIALIGLVVAAPPAAAVSVVDASANGIIGLSPPSDTLDYRFFGWTGGARLSPFTEETGSILTRDEGQGIRPGGIINIGTNTAEIHAQSFWFGGPANEVEGWIASAVGFQLLNNTDTELAIPFTYQSSFALSGSVSSDMAESATARVVSEFRTNEHAYVSNLSGELVTDPLYDVLASTRDSGIGDVFDFVGSEATLGVPTQYRLVIAPGELASFSMFVETYAQAVSSDASTALTALPEQDFLVPENISMTPIPLPASFGLFAAGLAGLFARQLPFNTLRRMQPD